MATPFHWQGTEDEGSRMSLLTVFQRGCWVRFAFTHLDPHPYNNYLLFSMWEDLQWLPVKLFLVSTVSVRAWPTLAAISQAESKGSHLVQSVFTPFVLTGATAIRKNS
jgi:hypothetical protein